MKSCQGLLLSLPEDEGTQPLQRRLYERLRRDLIHGALRPGQRLPSSRIMAYDLGLSRNTVVAALDRLIAEGYLQAKRGSGTYVCETLPEESLPQPTPCAPALAPTRQDGASACLEILPFSPHSPAHELFDADAWRRLLARRWRDANGLLLGQDADGGWRPLRRLLATQAQAQRGVMCDAERIIILPDRRSALHLALSLARQEDEKQGGFVSDPSSIPAALEVWTPSAWPPPAHQTAIAMHGARLRASAPFSDAPPCGETARQGKRFGLGRTEYGQATRVALVSANWPYPTGIGLSLIQRKALLRWASSSNALIIDDDPGGPLRYRGRPLPCLESLESGAEERVIICESLDAHLPAALRMAWLIVPHRLAGYAKRLRERQGMHVSLPEQMAVHDFIAEGHYAAHLRRARLLCVQRQQALLFAAERFWGDAIAVQASPVGWHLLGRLSPALVSTSAEALARQARTHGLWLEALSAHEPKARNLDRRREDALILGYAAFSPERLCRAAERLARLIDRPPQRRFAPASTAAA
jgi:GntR family transcriptional regulator / MocR family aminotransferase